MKLIAITGSPRAGKDTLHTIIDEVISSSMLLRGIDGPAYRVERRAMGDNLKILAAKMLGYQGTDEELVEIMDELKDTGTIVTSGPRGSTIGVRKYLLRLGLDAREMWGEDFWLDQVCPLDPTAFEAIWSTAGRPLPTSERVGLPLVCGVPGLRFPNEAERVKALRGTVVEIVRPALETDGDESGLALPRELVDYRVVNDGSLEDLRVKGEALVRELGLVP